VTGQAADDLSTQCGGWTIDWQGAGTNQIAGGTTLLAAIKQAVGPDTEVLFSAAGHNLKELKPADVVIAVIGEKPYAEFLGDRQDLRLAPADAELIARAKAIGAPVVTVLYSGRPLVLGAALEQSDAFVAAWLPGTEGQGMTDVLFGDFQPSGKLPRLWPASNDQVSVDHVVGQPQFAAGFGLTYTLYSQNK
jgi:beta-glucosidase